MYEILKTTSQRIDTGTRALYTINRLIAKHHIHVSTIRTLGHENATKTITIISM